MSNIHRANKARLWPCPFGMGGDTAPSYFNLVTWSSRGGSFKRVQLPMKSLATCTAFSLFNKPWPKQQYLHGQCWQATVTGRYEQNKAKQLEAMLAGEAKLPNTTDKCDKLGPLLRDGPVWTQNQGTWKPHRQLLSCWRGRVGSRGLSELPQGMPSIWTASSAFGLEVPGPLYSVSIGRLCRSTRTRG